MQAHMAQTGRELVAVPLLHPNGESLSLFQSSTLTLEPRRRTSGDGHFHFQLLPDVLPENDRLHRRTPRKIAQTVPPPRQRSGSGLRVEG